MNKKLLTLAVAAAMVAPLAVQAAGTGPTVYGVAHLSVENTDDDANENDQWDVQSRQSRFGIKGDEDLGNGLSAIYKMEFQVDMDDGSSLTHRNQYVGLSKKNIGTLIIGRHDTPMKFMTISRDQFNTTLGDWNEVTGNSGVQSLRDNRATNAILYKSPNFNGFEAAAMISPGEQNEADGNVGTGDPADGLADGIISLGARYVNGPIYIGAAYEESDFEDDTSGADHEEEETWRVAASYDIAGFKISGLYEETENVANNQTAAAVAQGVTAAGVPFAATAATFSADDIDNETWQLAVSYKFGNTTVKGMYQEGEQDNATAGASDLEYEAFAFGVDHSLSKRTRVYAVYTETDDEGPSATAEDTDSFGAGIIHKF